MTLSSSAATLSPMAAVRHGSRASERAMALFGLVACLAAAGTALSAQHFGGLIPCAFCLLERKPYYAGIVVAGLALALPKSAARPALWILAALLLTAAALSFAHVGVENHWWPDPLPECTAPDFSGMTMAQRLAAMPARPSKSCADPDYVFDAIPLSFAAMAFLYGMACSAILTLWLLSNRGRKYR